MKWIWKAGWLAGWLWLGMMMAAGAAKPAAAKAASPAAIHVRLDAATTPAGYLARLLINESPFPGERGYVSEENTKAAMLAILWVLHSRIQYIPPPYSQEQVAAVRTQNILDVITGGGDKSPCEGFFRDSAGRYKTVARVQERMEYLSKLANTGAKPGRFAALLNYGQGLARAYVASGIDGADRYAGLQRVGDVPVTGRAYAWMTDRDYYHPGGNFVAISDDMDGALGGNRFFTLRKVPK